MNRPTSTPDWTARTVGLLLFVGLLVVALPASAQAIKVTSAVPDTADQGTVGVVVSIGGENFASNSKVAFYVTGTKNPGGIAVKGVKYKDSKTLEATIDVAPDAQTELKFDIQVTSGSRTGKGTELFKVNVKVTGVDTIPPGTVAVLAETSSGDNSVRLSYPLPADDADNPASGPAVHFDFRVRKGYSPETPSCGMHTADLWAASAYNDPCIVYYNSGNLTGVPGATQTVGPMYLAPSTEYWAMVRSRDDATPDGNWSLLSSDLSSQVSFTTGPAPTTPWMSEVAEACPPLTYSPTSCYVEGDTHVDFGPDGRPALLYVRAGSLLLASQTGSDWRIEPVWNGIAIGSFDFAFDPSGFATIARAGLSGGKSDLRYFRRTGATSGPWETEVVATSSVATAKTALAFDPIVKTPAIAYTYTKANTSILRLAERRGASWTSQDITSQMLWSYYDLTFDAAGNPAMTYSWNVNGTSVLAFALRENGVWRHEVIADAATAGAGFEAHRNAVAFDPLRGDFASVCRFKTPACCAAKVLYCERDKGSWDCEMLDEARSANGVDLEIGPDGTVYVGYDSWYALFAAVRAPGTPWTREYVIWDTSATPDVDLKLHPGDGRLGITGRGQHDGTGAGLTYSVKFALRP